MTQSVTLDHQHRPDGSLESSTPSTAKISFGKRSAFTQELHQRVEAYFRDNHKKKRGNPAMYVKTIVIVAWIFGSWAFLLLTPQVLGLKLLGCVMMGLAIAAYPMNVFHDAAHGGYSNNATLNRWLSFGGDVMGISNYFWRIRHNKLHHIYTNIPGYDMEIHGDGFVRMAPSAEHLWHHQYQHIFIWLVYPIIPIYWALSEVHLFFTACTGSASYLDNPIPKPKPADVVVFVVSRLVGLGFFVGLPLSLGYPLWQVFLGLILIYMVYGLVAVQVFMLAHILEKADFPTVDENDRHLDEDWVLFQMRTTADFAHRNPIVTWYLGGLNYQVVHHLFTDICHIHYPDLADILADVSAKHGVTYRRYDTSWDAIVSSYRWLKLMGQRPDTALAQ